MRVGLTSHVRGPTALSHLPNSMRVAHESPVRLRRPQRLGGTEHLRYYAHGVAVSLAPLYPVSLWSTRSVTVAVSVAARALGPGRVTAVPVRQPVGERILRRSVWIGRARGPWSWRPSRARIPAHRTCLAGSAGAGAGPRAHFTHLLVAQRLSFRPDERIRRPGERRIRDLYPVRYAAPRRIHGRIRARHRGGAVIAAAPAR